MSKLFGMFPGKRSGCTKKRCTRFFMYVFNQLCGFLCSVPNAAFKLHNHYPEQLSGKDLPQKRTCGNRKQREKSYLAVVAIKQCARRNADCNCTEKRIRRRCRKSISPYPYQSE